MPSGKLAKGILSALLVLGGHIPRVHAASYGILDHQEKADVIFRDLNILPDIHGGIYERYLMGDPDNASNHLVYQMTGIVDTEWCLSGVLCVKSVRRIEPIALSLFETIETPYYGAFTYQSPMSRLARKRVLEIAVSLRERYSNPIDYIIMPPEPVEALSENYFQYEDFNDNGTIEADEITRMRSDAFVEYCYAAAGFPIMDVNIATTEGAWVLQFRSGAKLLFPTDQQARMVSATIQKPEVHVYEDETNRELLSGDATSKESFHVFVEDFLSGPGRLEIWDKEPTPAGTPNYFLHYFFDNIGHNYNSADFSALGNLPEGKWWIRAIDQAGNHASVDFPPFFKIFPVGNGFYLIPQILVANTLKFTTNDIALDQIKRYTAPYARHVALCQPLARLASAPQARPELLLLAGLAGTGKNNLLCGVRRAAASRYAYAPRTARYTASYPRDVAGAPTRRPIGGAAPVALRLPQEKRYAASYARVAVGGRSSGGQLPRSPAGDFFFSPARKEIINKRIVKMMAAKAVKRILPGALHKEFLRSSSLNFPGAAPRRRFSCG